RSVASADRTSSQGAAAMAERDAPASVAREVGEERAGAAPPAAHRPARRAPSAAPEAWPVSHGSLPADREAPDPLRPFVLSAASPEALRDQALRLIHHLGRDHRAPLAGVAPALAATRA